MRSRVNFFYLFSNKQIVFKWYRHLNRYRYVNNSRRALLFTFFFIFQISIELSLCCVLFRHVNIAGSSFSFFIIKYVFIESMQMVKWWRQILILDAIEFTLVKSTPFEFDVAMPSLNKQTNTKQKHRSDKTIKVYTK